MLVVNHHLFFADLGAAHAAGANGRGRAARATRRSSSTRRTRSRTRPPSTSGPGLQLPPRGAGPRRAGGAAGGGRARRACSRRWRRQVRAEAEALSGRGAAGAGADGARATVRLTPAGCSRRSGAGAGGAGGRWAPSAAYASGHEEPDARRAGATRSRARRRSWTSSGEADSPDHVYWAEARGRGLFLRAAPDRRGQGAARAALRRGGHGGLHLGHAHAPRAASTTSRGGWGCRRRGRGQSRHVTPARGAVPFDYASRRRSTCRRTCRSRRRRASSRRWPRRSLGFCEVTGGPRVRALHVAAQHGARRTRCCSGRLPYQVLLQGERPKPALLEAFRAAPSVLFASHELLGGRGRAGRCAVAGGHRQAALRLADRPAGGRAHRAAGGGGARSRSTATSSRRRRWRCGRASAGSSGRGPTAASWRCSTSGSDARPTGASCWRVCPRRVGSRRLVR